MTLKWIHRYQRKPGRWVFEPTDEAKAVGLRVKKDVASRWTAPDFNFHLRTGGHVAAAYSHVANRYFFRADLDDFFGRVNRSRVTRCLKAWFPYSIARAMASESVVRRPGSEDFVLPYGFVQSPILASLALDKSKLGTLLRSLARRSDLRLSVYVDDIIISGDDAAMLGEVAEHLTQAAFSSRFPINQHKTEGPAETITAFNIRISQNALHITETRLNELKDRYKNNISPHSQAGIISYVQSVNPSQVNSFDTAIG